MQKDYETFARELHRILDGDTRFPIEAVYTVKHRIKDHGRLIAKISSENGKAGKRKQITHENFPDRINDLLGIRVICLRNSDLNKVQEYLTSLVEEDRLKVLKGPIEKKTFVVREPEAKTKTDMQYSGYASIHYVVKLGRALKPQKDIADLRAELQLRTIFEEAWGEIDHKYRYEFTRADKPVPSHVSGGFRDLSLYLLAASCQAEHLCHEVERTVNPDPRRSRKRFRRRKVGVRTSQPAGANGMPAVAPSPTSLRDVFKAILGFEPTPRTIGYCTRRLEEHSYFSGTRMGLTEFADCVKAVLDRFTNLYKEVFQRSPFSSTDSSERDLDVIPLVNFALFSTTQSAATAEAGLRASLRRRYPQWKIDTNTSF